MYYILLFLHSIGRWLVLISLLYAISRAYKGYRFNSAFTQKDNNIRHWTATTAHLQMMIGVVLYSQSPLIKIFFNSSTNQNQSSDPVFFAIIHLGIMVIAILLITIGSALAKRKKSDQDKYRTMLYWFAAALLLILLAIPWPFSPFAHRPFIRPF
jgi:uncharacterized membrane protein YozB (DUF420 family)